MEGHSGILSGIYIVIEATRVFESLVAFLTEKNYNERVRGYSTSVVP